MTAAPSLLHTDLAAGRRDDLRRPTVTHRLVRPDARPRGVNPAARRAGARLAPL